MKKVDKNFYLHFLICYWRVAGLGTVNVWKRQASFLPDPKPGPKPAAPPSKNRLKVFDQTFFKKFAEREAEPRGLPQPKIAESWAAPMVERMVKHESKH
ncbi:hypothetical protein [Acutalibacter sp.]|uniref:hypothetical protein n=1 Tax=Acutalibacter sp. TaxID=1918636 RepID=UPI00216CDE05|nr:hypothetical protein [Acutalibacter sp.]